MAAYKEHIEVWDGVTLTAGAADNVIAKQISTGHGGLMTMRITNGATGPTVEAQITLEISYDGSKWFAWSSSVDGGTTNDAVTTSTIDIPIGIKNIRVTGGGNTAEDVVVDCSIMNVVGISE